MEMSFIHILVAFCVGVFICMFLYLIYYFGDEMFLDSTEVKAVVIGKLSEQKTKSTYYIKVGEVLVPMTSGGGVGYQIIAEIQEPESPHNGKEVTISVYSEEYVLINKDQKISIKYSLGRFTKSICNVKLSSFFLNQ